MLTVTMFRDTLDTLPRPQQMSVHKLCDLLAPSHPSVRQDIASSIHKKVGVLEDALNAIMTRKQPRPWLRDHQWYRALELVEWQNSDKAPEIVAELVKAKTVEIAEGIHRKAKTRLPCWSPAIYAPRQIRSRDGVVAVSCLVLDYDDGTDIDEALSPWEQHTVLLHSSWSHTVSHPRFRLVLPLHEPVAASEWPAVWRWAESRSLGVIDKACKDPSRLYLLPAVPSRLSPYERRVLNVGGPLLKPGRVAAPPPRRRAQGALQPMHAQARQILNTSQAARERAADHLGATVRSGRAEYITCPGCGRPSVWFWLAPGQMSTAACKHKNSCRWWGHLDTLLDARGRDVG